MARFVFELEAVLRQRESEELRAQVRVANVEAERVALERRIRASHEFAQGERELMREFLGEGMALGEARGAGVLARVDVEAARRQAGAINHAMGEAQRAVIQLAGVHRRLEQARAELVRCATRRKAVEALRERRWQAYEAEAKRREGAAADELNITRGARASDEAEVIA